MTEVVHATRDDPDAAGELSAAPPMGPAPARMVVAADSEPRGARWRRIAPGTGLSVAIHALLAILFLMVWRSMVRDLTAPEPISVEVVHSIPGDDKPAAPPVGPKAAAAPDPPRPETPKPEEPQPAPAPPPPPPAAPVQPDPLPLPAVPPPPTPETQTPQPEAPQPRPLSPSDLKGALAEPPPEPKAAATQTETNLKANAAEDPAKSLAPDETVKADAPKVLTTPDAETIVPEQTKQPDPQRQPKTSDPDQPTSTDPAAHLMAALPMSGLSMPSSFRAILSSAGTSESQQYKGAVFGALARAEQVMGEQARRRRLKGQVVLAIDVTDTGVVASMSVIQSSGDPAVDAFALDLVRKSSPFPPPPPGASHTFTPALTFGDN